MDFLPVELVRLVFQYCDVATVKALRLVSARFAAIGEEYLVPAHLHAVEWRDDVKRLHAIASHPRLRNTVRSVTFNFSRVNEYNARHTSFFQHWLQDPEERNNLLNGAWARHYEIEKRTKALPSFNSRSLLLDQAFRRLPNLRELDITFTQCPYDNEVLKEVFQVPSCRQRDRAQACKNMNAIVSATRHASHLSSLSIDQLPLELFRNVDDRRHWFDCCARSFSNLTRLDLVIDPPANMLPTSRFRAINGLGHVLQFAPNLTHLSLSFHAYYNPKEKFNLSLRALLGGDRFCWEKLTDFKLEGVSCAEDDLRSFLVRHGGTLERLRLGGRGLAAPHKPSVGGIHLHEGSFRSLFASLHGKLCKLQRFHLEGDAESGDIMTRAREVYKFHAVTDDNWKPVATVAKRRAGVVNTVDCLEIERYLIHGGEFPSILKVAGTSDSEVSV